MISLSASQRLIFDVYSTISTVYGFLPNKVFSYRHQIYLSISHTFSSLFAFIFVHSPLRDQQIITVVNSRRNTVISRSIYYLSSVFLVNSAIVPKLGQIKNSQVSLEHLWKNLALSVNPNINLNRGAIQSESTIGEK